MSSGDTGGLSPACIEEIERLATEKLERHVRSYIQKGAGGSVSVRENRRAYDRWRLWPRVLAGVSERHTEVTLLGRRVSMPIGISATGGQKLVHPDAELAVARGERLAEEPRGQRLPSLKSSVFILGTALVVLLAGRNTLTRQVFLPGYFNCGCIA
ncbi:2-Hydroxyacid oxidase 1-like [Haemaphysalis longicornis]